MGRTPGGGVPSRGGVADLVKPLTKIMAKQIILKNYIYIFIFVCIYMYLNIYYIYILLLKNSGERDYYMR